MSPAFVKRHDIGTNMKKEPFPLMGFDGKPVTYNNGIVSRETQTTTSVNRTLHREDSV